MKNQFVPYELALKLKELGFDEECLGGYIYLSGSKSYELAFYKDRIINFNKTSNIYVSAPLWQQAGNFLYICSNKKINISINGDDTYKELCEKFEKAISDFRDLQNNKSKR